MSEQHPDTQTHHPSNNPFTVLLPRDSHFQHNVFSAIHHPLQQNNNFSPSTHEEDDSIDEEGGDNNDEEIASDQTKRDIRVIFDCITAINKNVSSLGNSMINNNRHLQNIGREVHFMSRSSKLNVLHEVGHIPPSFATIDNYMDRLNIYSIATSYLLRDMDAKLFVYLTPERISTLKTFKDVIREAKHKVVSQGRVNKLSEENIKRMEAWYHAIKNLERTEQQFYAFTSKRRITMGSAETLSNDLVNLLDYDTKMDYNNRRNALINTENFDDSDTTKLKTLGEDLQRWRENLHLDFLITKYTMHLSKTTEIQMMHGRGVTGDVRKDDNQCRRKFIKNICDDKLKPLITENEKIGQTWIKVTGTNAIEDATALDPTKKTNLRKLLGQTLSDMVDKEAILTLDPYRFAKLEIRFISSQTKISVDGNIFQPTNTETITKIETSNDEEFAGTTQELLKFYRELYYKNKLNPNAVPQISRGMDGQGDAE